MTDVSVVVPTYNEEENIQELLQEIDSELEDYSYEIVVIDDSDDSTAGKIREIEDELEKINLNVREEAKGIGSAYKEGFGKADGDKIIQMDADFSHDPKYLPDMIEALENSDLVVGSRYVDGGDRNDPLHRRINPLIGSYLYQYGIGSPVKDVTSGFKAYNSDVIEMMSEDLPDGFHFQAASLMSLVDDVEVTEYPIDFRPRRAGEPKYSFRDFLDNVKLLLKLFKTRKLGK